MKKKNWYKGLTATAVTLAMAGAVLTVPAFAGENTDLSGDNSEQIDVQNIAEQAAIVLPGNIEAGTPVDGEPEYPTTEDGSDVTVTSSTTVDKVVDDEETQIGSIEKDETTTETVKPPVYDSDNSVSEVIDSVTNPDGSTTVTTETTTPGTQETVTDVEGSVDGDATVTDTETEDKEEIEEGLVGEDTTIEDVLEDVGEDQTSEKPSSTIVIGDKVWSYEVSEDGNSFTFTKEEIQESELDNAVIVEILGDGYKLGEDGKIYTTDDNEVTITYDEENPSKVTITTTIEVVTKDEVSVDLGSEEIVDKDGNLEDDYQITVDGDGNIHLGSTTGTSSTDKHGNVTYEFSVDDDNKITITFKDSKDKLTAEEIVEILGTGYSCDAEGNIYYQAEANGPKFDVQVDGLEFSEVTVTEETDVTDAPKVNFTVKVEGPKQEYEFVDENGTKHTLKKEDVKVNEKEGTCTFTIDGKEYTVNYEVDKDTTEGPKDTVDGVYQGPGSKEYMDAKQLEDYIKDHPDSVQDGAPGEKVITITDGDTKYKYTLKTETYKGDKKDLNKITEWLGGKAEGYEVKGDKLYKNGEEVTLTGEITKTTVSVEATKTETDTATGTADGDLIGEDGIQHEVAVPGYGYADITDKNKELGIANQIASSMGYQGNATKVEGNKYTFTDGNETTTITVVKDQKNDRTPGHKPNDDNDKDVSYTVEVETSKTVEEEYDSLKKNDQIKQDADKVIKDDKNFDHNSADTVKEVITQTATITVKKADSCWFPCLTKNTYHFSIQTNPCSPCDDGIDTSRVVTVTGTQTKTNRGNKVTYTGKITATNTTVDSVIKVEQVVKGLTLSGSVAFDPYFAEKTVNTKYDYIFDYAYQDTQVDSVDPKVEQSEFTIPADDGQIILPDIDDTVTDDGGDDTVIDDGEDDTVIDDEDVPLVSGDDTAEDTTGDYEEIEDDETPLAGPTDDEVDDIIADIEAEINDEVVPLASVPQTGVPADNGVNGAAAAGAAGVAALAAAVLFRKARRSK